MQFRQGTVADVPVLLNLIRSMAAYEKLEVFATEGSLRLALFGDDRVATPVLAEYDGRPIGYAIYYFAFSSMLGRRTFWLEDLYVEPEFRRKGIGMAFMRHLALIAVQHKCARCDWIVLQWNSTAVDFYRSIGAEVLPDWRICRLDERNLNRAATG